MEKGEYQGILEQEWAKKFKNNKRLQNMKPIDLFGTDLASETGRQAINSFINGKSFPERIYDYKPNAFSSPELRFIPLPLF